MKLKKSMIIGISAILTFAAIGISSAAWFQISNSQTVSTTGSTAATYFAGGNGTEEDPYIITRPVHMYNLAWLQYNGEFNNNNAPYHFRIGGDGTDYPVITELDMSGYILPPIGTVNQPFIGVFDGNDATITNLQVSNVYGTEEGNIIKKPTKIATSGTLSGVNIVGLFGVVGDYAGAASSYDTSATSIFDLKIKDAEIRSQLQSTLIGVAAGYVNGDVLSNVGIINSTINLPDSSTAYGGMTSNVSDYSVIGYQKADEGKSTLTTSRDTVSIPATDYTDTTAATTGQVAAWGASIDMKSIYGRVLQKYREADNSATFRAGVASGTATQTVTVDNTVSPSVTTKNPVNYTGNPTYYTGSYKKNYNTSTKDKKLEGQYFFKSESRTRYILLSGNSNKYDDDNTTLTVTTNTKNRRSYDGYTFSATAPATNYYKIAFDVPQTSYYVIKATRNGATYYMTDAGDYAGVTTDLNSAESWVFASLGGSGLITSANGTGNLNWYSSRLYTDDYTTARYANFTTNTSTHQIIYSYNGQYVYFTGSNNTSGTAWQLTSDGSADGLAVYEEIIIPAGTYYLQVEDGEIYGTESSSDEGTDWVFSNYSTSSGATTTIKSPVTDTYLYPSTSTVSLNANSRDWTFDGSGHIYYNYGNGYFLGMTGDSILMSTNPSAKATVSFGSTVPAHTVYMGMDKNQNLIMVDNEEDATRWGFSSPSGTTTTIYTYVDDDQYFLSPSTSGVSVSKNSTEIRRQNGYYCYRYNNNNYYYISYVNGNWGTVQNNYTNAANRSSTTQTIYYVETTTSTETKYNQNCENTMNGYYETYMPLSVQGTTTVTTTNESNNTATTTNFAPTDTNTGYLISGGSYGVDRSSSSYDNDDGDIRVSWFKMSDMNHSHNGISSYTTSNRSQVEVITRTQATNDWVRISDDFNKNNTNIASGKAKNCNYGISDITQKITYGKDGLNLQKYLSSRNQLDQTFLEAPKYIYGLHFMDATISINNLAVAEIVHIDEHDYENYQMPRDSIDFKLRETGYINFFAGTYYNNSTSDQNNSFFSLNKIERNETTNAITAIHQISKIYGKDGDQENGYWYLYDDNSDGTIDGYCGPNGETTAPTAGWAQVFDCAWIMQRSDLVMNALYYFEIPVMDGEYALGSVPSTNSSNTAKGAYLMYLDIGASAARVNRTIVLQTITKNTDVYIYPRGIAIIATAAEDVIDYISAAYTLSAGYEGSFGMSKTGNVITSDADTGQTYSATFKGEGVTLEDADSGDTLTPTPESSETFTIHRTTMIDYNRSAKEYGMTVIDDYMDAEGNFDHREVMVRSTTTVDDEHVWGDWTVLDDLGEWATDKYTMTYIETPEMGYAYSYYAADGVELKIEWGLDYEQIDGDERHNYQEITGLTLTINGKTTVADPNDIVVTMVDGQTTYTIRINNTTIQVTIDGDDKTFTPPTIAITPTVVPPNNP